MNVADIRMTFTPNCSQLFHQREVSSEQNVGRDIWNSVARCTVGVAARPRVHARESVPPSALRRVEFSSKLVSIHSRALLYSHPNRTGARRCNFYVTDYSPFLAPRARGVRSNHGRINLPARDTRERETAMTFDAASGEPLLLLSRDGREVRPLTRISMRARTVHLGCARVPSRSRCSPLAHRCTIRCVAGNNAQFYTRQD